MQKPPGKVHIKSSRRLAVRRLPFVRFMTSLRKTRSLDYVHISTFRACLQYLVTAPAQPLELAKLWSTMCQPVPGSIATRYRDSALLLAHLRHLSNIKDCFRLLSSKTRCSIGEAFAKRLHPLVGEQHLIRCTILMKSSPTGFPCSGFRQHYKRCGNCSGVAIILPS